MERMEPAAYHHPTSPERVRLADALRDLENAKARVERDARQVADDTRKDLVRQLLPVMDNLDRTITAATETGDAPAVVEGVGLVKSQLERVLSGYGVERIDAIGEPFDPRVHEAVTTRVVLTRDEHDQVVEQLAPGYRFGSQVMRAATVVVGKLSAAAAPPPAELAVVCAATPVAGGSQARRAAEPERPDAGLACDSEIDHARGQSSRAPQARQPRYVDHYGRPVDEYGRPLAATQLDAYGRPITFDRYGRPMRAPQPDHPFARRFR